MKFSVQVLVILVLGFLLGHYVAWWGVAIAAFLGGVFVRNRVSFLGGFLGIGILWFASALWITGSAATDYVSEVAAILQASTTIILLATGLIGGLVGGLAALAGSLLRTPRKSSNPYRL